MLNKPAYLATFRTVAYSPASDDEVQFEPSSSLWMVPGSVAEMEVASVRLRQIYNGSGE